MLQLTLNPGLTLTNFQTTRPNTKKLLEKSPKKARALIG